MLLRHSIHVSEWLKIKIKKLFFPNNFLYDVDTSSKSISYV